MKADIDINQRLREIAKAHNLNPEKFRIFWNTRFDNNDLHYAEEWAKRIQRDTAHELADRETREALREAGIHHPEHPYRGENQR